MVDEHIHPKPILTDPEPTTGKAWMVLRTQRGAGGFIPSLVEAGDPGHAPAIGREGGEPWYWGTTWEQACTVVDDANRKDFGLEPAAAGAILASSIAAQIRRDARRVEASDRLDRLTRH